CHSVFLDRRSRFLSPMNLNRPKLVRGHGSIFSIRMRFAVFVSRGDNALPFRTPRAEVPSFLLKLRRLRTTAFLGLQRGETGISPATSNDNAVSIPREDFSRGLAASIRANA